MLRWEGFGGTAVDFYYSYWDRGEELPLYYQGTSTGTALAFRPEPQYDANQGDVFRNEKRYVASGPSVDAPFDARGIMLLSYRYKASFGPKATTKNDDTWVYVPTLRRVRRISSAQRTDAVAGTDFTFDDLFSFNGIVPQYDWTCLGEMDILAPMRTKVMAYPYEKDHNFGPYGLSFADDRWELRHAHQVPLHAAHLRSSLQPQGHLHRQELDGADVLLRLRPQGRALEDHLAQQALESGAGLHRVQGLGERAGAARPHAW